MASQWTYDSAAFVAANNSANLTISLTVVPPVGSLLLISGHNHATTSFSTGAISDNSSGGGAWHAGPSQSGSVPHFSTACWYKVANAADFNGGAGITVTITWAGGSGTLLNRMRADIWTLPTGYVPSLGDFSTTTGGSNVTGLSTFYSVNKTWADALAVNVLFTATTTGGSSATFTNPHATLASMTAGGATGNALLNTFYLPVSDLISNNDNYLESWITNVTSPVTSGMSFTYTPAAPTVTNVNPNTNGNTAGGDSVTITGTNFTDSGGAWQATAVSFGGTPATSVVVVNATTITCVSPAGTGTVDVTVTSIGGTSATSPSDQFTYGSTPPPPTPTVTPSGGSGGEGEKREIRAWWDTDEERDLEALINLGAL